MSEYSILVWSLSYVSSHDEDAQVKCTPPCCSISFPSISDMVRTYSRKSGRLQNGESAIKKSLEALSNGEHLRAVSRIYGVPCKTLRQHRDGKVRVPGAARLGRYDTIFTPRMENDIRCHVLEMERRLFGLTQMDVRKLAFSVAEQAGIKHPFSGADWLAGFMKRNPDISLRKPEGTSMSRAVAFNRERVQQFFAMFKESVVKHGFSPREIWNMDEKHAGGEGCKKEKDDSKGHTKEKGKPAQRKTTEQL